MINFDYYFPSLLNHFCVWPSHSPLRKLLNILDKCWETLLTTALPWTELKKDVFLPSITIIIEKATATSRLWPQKLL